MLRVLYAASLRAVFHECQQYGRRNASTHAATFTPAFAHIGRHDRSWRDAVFSSHLLPMPLSASGNFSLYRRCRHRSSFPPYGRPPLLLRDRAVVAVAANETRLRPRCWRQPVFCREVAADDFALSIAT